MGQPIIGWRGKSRLRLAKDLIRKHVRHRLAKNMFRCRPEESFQLQPRRHIPRNELGELVVQKWHAHLDRAGHAHFVVIRKVEAGHEDFGIEVQHLIQEVGIANLLKRFFVSAVREIRINLVA